MECEQKDKGQVCPAPVLNHYEFEVPLNGKEIPNSGGAKIHKVIFQQWLCEKHLKEKLEVFHIKT